MELSIPSIKYSELEDAMSFVGSSFSSDAEAYICRKSGKIYLVSNEYEEEFEVPDDVGDCNLYAAVPHPHDLDLGKRLALRFTAQELPNCYDQVSAIFRRKGAYSRYKGLLQENGKLEEWYKFEETAIETALCEWARDEGFKVDFNGDSGSADRVYQLKIALKDITPTIWRRIQIPETYSFWDLHVAIQDAMGWLDYHLHAFRIPQKHDQEAMEIGIPDEHAFEGSSKIHAGWEIPIIDYFHDVGVTSDYEYDFGDGWQHKVELEGILLREKDQKYPRCIDGERACPPEDCGGIHGYRRLLEVLSNPSHDEHDEMLLWLGGKFDADSFSSEKVRFDNPMKRWREAFSEGYVLGET